MLVAPASGRDSRLRRLPPARCRAVLHVAPSVDAQVRASFVAEPTLENPLPITCSDDPWWPSLVPTTLLRSGGSVRTLVCQVVVSWPTITTNSPSRSPRITHLSSANATSISCTGSSAANGSEMPLQSRPSLDRQATARPSRLPMAIAVPPSATDFTTVVQPAVEDSSRSTISSPPTTKDNGRSVVAPLSGPTATTVPSMAITEDTRCHHHDSSGGSQVGDTAGCHPSAVIA